MQLLVMFVALLLLLLLCTGAVVPGQNETNFSKDLRTMIFYLTERSAVDYQSYGCWCGTNANVSTHDLTMDEIDFCCKQHTICWTNLSLVNETTCDDGAERYRAIFSHDQIQCVDHDESLSRRRCLCDRQLAFCLQQSQSTYDPEKKMSSTSDLCEAKAPNLIWDPNGVTIAGSTGVSGATDRLLNLPYALILVSNTTLFISDQNNNRVQKWFIGSMNGTTVAGQANGEIGSTSRHFRRPGAIAMDNAETLFVVDINNHRVQLWPNGSSEGRTIAGATGVPGAELNQLNTPFGIARNARTGVLYIADRDNHRVLAVSTNETTGTIVAGGNGPGIGKRQLHSPIGLFFDSTSNSLLIVNYGVHNVVRWVLGEDSWTLVAGSPTGVSGSTSTLLFHPVAVTMDRWKNVYVADTSNHRIQFFPAEQMNGTTIAGVTASFGSNAKQLRYPFAVLLDPQLNLYVADTYNHRIQKFLRINETI